MGMVRAGGEGVRDACAGVAGVGIALKRALERPCLDPLNPFAFVGHRYSIIQAIIVSGEPSVQYFFRRAFWWSHAWLHPDDLPCDSLVVLSGFDTVRTS